MPGKRGQSFPIVGSEQPFRNIFRHLSRDSCSWGDPGEESGMGRKEIGFGDGEERLGWLGRGCVGRPGGEKRLDGKTEVGRRDEDALEEIMCRTGVGRRASRRRKIIGVK